MTDHRDCTLCNDTGWVLDGSDRDKAGPRMLELIECPIPDCKASGREIQAISFKGIEQRFRHASFHPTEHYVMSITQ